MVWLFHTTGDTKRFVGNKEVVKLIDLCLLTEDVTRESEDFKILIVKVSLICRGGNVKIKTLHCDKS